MFLNKFTREVRAPLTHMNIITRLRYVSMLKNEFKGRQEAEGRREEQAMVELQTGKDHLTAGYAG